MSLLSALNNIHMNRDSEAQWKRAVGFMREMTEAEITTCWINFSSQIPHHDTASASITLTQYKRIFKGVHRDSRTYLQPAIPESTQCNTADFAHMLAEQNKLMKKYKMFLSTLYLCGKFRDGSVQKMIKSIEDAGDDDVSEFSGELREPAAEKNPATAREKETKNPIISINEKLSAIQATLKTLQDKSTGPAPTAADGGPPSAAVVAAADEYRNVPKAINEALTKFIELGMDQRHAAIAGIEEAQNNENELREMTNQAIDSVHKTLQEIPASLEQAILKSELNVIPQNITELKITMEKHNSELVSLSEKTAVIMQCILDILRNQRGNIIREILNLRGDIVTMDEEFSILHAETILHAENHDNFSSGLDDVQECVNTELSSVANEIKTLIKDQTNDDIDEAVLTKINSIVDGRVEQGTQTILEIIHEVHETIEQPNQADTLDSDGARVTESDTATTNREAPVTATRNISKTGGRRIPRSTRAHASALNKSPYAQPANPKNFNQYGRVHSPPGSTPIRRQGP
jgi:hypothetical protein